MHQKAHSDTLSESCLSAVFCFLLFLWSVCSCSAHSLRIFCSLSVLLLLCSALSLFFFCSFSCEGVFGSVWASLLISPSLFFCCSSAALSLFLFLFFVCSVGRPDRSILQKLFNSSPTRPPTRLPTRPKCSSNRVLFCSCSALLLLFCCSFAALLLSSICSCSALQQLFRCKTRFPFSYQTGSRF